MKIHSFLFAFFNLFTIHIIAQTDTSASTFWQPIPRNYEVKQALEFESLVPMFLTGGFHYAVGYRYRNFRFRFSVINGGHYNAEPAGIKNSSSDYKRFYKTSPGFFLGYNIWKNFELFTFLEFHTFAIEQKSTDIQKNLHSTDFGGGVSYQFFIGKCFYIQPGLHLYLRGDHSIDFDGKSYHIPNADFGPVLRLGFRYWKRY